MTYNPRSNNLGDLPEFFKVASNTKALEALKPDITAANIVCPFILQDINTVAVEVEYWLRELYITQVITEEQRDKWARAILDAMLEFALTIPG
jgi:hypothetical protein